MSYKLNENEIRRLHQCAITALEKTGNSIRIDVDDSQTIPFLTGQMDQSGDVVPDGDGFALIYSVPYARYQYFTPLQHYKGQHKNATDHWLDPYMEGGTKEHWTAKTFAKHMVKEFNKK
jgi:hypothetical protein